MLCIRTWIHATHAVPVLANGWARSEKGTQRSSSPTNTPRPPQTRGRGVMMMRRALKGPFGKHLFGHHTDWLITQSTVTQSECERAMKTQRGAVCEGDEKWGTRLKRWDKVQRGRGKGDKLRKGRLWAEWGLEEEREKVKNVWDGAPDRRRQVRPGAERTGRGGVLKNAF